MSWAVILANISRAEAALTSPTRKKKYKTTRSCPFLKSSTRLADKTDFPAPEKFSNCSDATYLQWEVKSLRVFGTECVNVASCVMPHGALPRTL
jgi:hypothetical protein